MAVQNSHLRFLPRSVQLSKPPPPPMDTDNKKMNKKKHRNSIDHSAREESNFSPTEEFELQAQRKRKIKNSGHVIEEESGKTNSSPAAIRVDGDSNGLKKKKKEKEKKRDDPNTHSAEAAELNQLIAGFLSSRGLTNTLSVFLSETQHAYAGKAQTLDLEEIYSHYLNQGSAKFKKQGEVKLREQAGDAVFKDAGKLNKGVKRKGNDIKAMDGKEKYVDDSNAAPPSTGASEQGFYKTDNNHDSAKESMDDLDGHGHSKRTAMGSKNSAVSIGTYEGRNELSKPTDDLGVVWELSEPVLKFQEVPMKEEKKKKKKKKKKKMADESLLSDNNEKVDGKKSKKEKKAHAAKLFSTGFHGINAEAVNGSILDLLEDSRNELDIKKSSLDKTNWRDHEVLCGSKKSKKEEKQFEEKLLSTSSHTVNGEAAKGGRGYLLDDPENLLDMQLSKKKRRSDGMMSGDAQEHISCKKNKKGKQTLEDKLVATELHFSYPINVEVATGCREHSPEDPGNTLDVGVPNKKKKRSDVMIPRDAEEQIEGKKSKKGKKVLAEKSLSTDAHAINGQASKGTMEGLSEEHGNSLHIKMSKKKKKSDEMVVRDNEDLTGGNKSKKGKKGFEEKLCSSGSHAVNGEMAKESMGGLDADTNNTLDITWNSRILEAKELAKGAEVQSNEHCPVVNGYQERGIPGKLHDGKEVIKGHLPAKSRKSEQQKSDVPTAAKSFQRVTTEEVEFADPRLQDNSYWAKDGAENGYGAKVQEVLGQVRGKNFLHEKTKKKRGTYTGGMIDVQSHSIKFSYSDEK